MRRSRAIRSSAAVRPEKIRIQAVSGTPAENSAAVGTIVEAIYLGDWVKYRIELVSGETMLVKVPGGNEDELGAPGTRVVITIATRDLMVYRE